MYNAAKGGVHGLTTGLARELAADGVTVNCVAPSIVATEPSQACSPHPDDDADGVQPDADQAIGLIPMGRPAISRGGGRRRRVPRRAEEASFITGQVISVNGGSSML